MVCGKCRYVNNEAAKTCRHCGAPLQERTSGARIPAARDKAEHKKTAVGIGDAGRTLIFNPPGTKKPAARSAIVSKSFDDEYNREEYEERHNNRKFTAVIIGLAAIMIAGMAVFFALLFSTTGGDETSLSVSPTPASTLTPEPTLTAAGVSAAVPEPTEDISSVFTRPSNAIATE